MISFWRYKGKAWECDDFIPNKDHILRPAYFPFDDKCILVPKGMCDGMERISRAEYLATLKYDINYDGELRTRPDSSRALLDVGNLPIDYASVYSGTAVTLSGDGKIEVPINQGHGSVTIFDHATKTFTQPTLPLASTYTLKDGTYGTIIKLDTNTFSQADLDAFTARPELVLDWANGTATIPSAIVKGAKDVVYNAKGMALPIVLGAELVVNCDFSDGTNGWTQSNGWVIANGVTTVSTTGSAWGANSNILAQANKTYVSSFEIITIAKGALTQRIGGEISPPYSTVGVHTYIATPTSETTIWQTKSIGETTATYDNVSVKEITSPTIPITGTHTTTNTSPYGVQSITQGTGNINGGADGRYITLPLTQPKDYLVTKCIDSIKGDNKEVIVYNCDGTTETIKA